jgi:hypothetical protein
MQTNYRGFTVAPKAINDMPCRLILLAALMSRSSAVNLFEMDFFLIGYWILA